MDLSFCSYSLSSNTTNIHHYKNKQIDSLRLMGVGYSCLLLCWSLGGNQDSDKYRMVPPLYFSMKKNYLLLIVLMILMSVITVQAQETYSVYNEENKMLTIYYDTQKDKRNGRHIDNPFHFDYETQGNFGYEIEIVEYDTSFANYPLDLDDIPELFSDCIFSEIRGLENLNTENATDMYRMFYHCWRLKSIDLSCLKANKVESMAQMFDNCCSLESVNLNGFKADHLKNIWCMFSGCEMLENIDFSGFDAKNIELMGQLFMCCYNLKNINFNGFDTKHVTNMVNVFQNCTNLTSVDLSGFNTANVVDMWGMFIRCSNLTTIYVGDGWTVENIRYPVDNMFEDCESLMGGKGTKYNSNHIDISYARIDGGPSKPGYLTKKDPNVIKILVSDNRKDESVYTLGGQRLSSPKKGVNIIDGHKVVIR